MTDNNMTPEYKAKLEDALIYQDFIADELRKRGIYLGAYSSKKYQREKGESCSGIEVKNDKNMWRTRNVYIETDEKPNAQCPKWYPSTIYRDKDTWGLIIGDYNEAFLFSTRQLRMICEHSNEWKRQHGIRHTGNLTSKAILLPIENYVLKSGIAILHFNFKESKQ